MSYPLVILAGLNVELHDSARAQSGNLFAPKGHLVLLPTQSGLSDAHAQALISAARTHLRTLDEATEVNCIVLAAHEPGANARNFRRLFFPFGLFGTIELPAFPKGISRNRRNVIKNDSVRRLIRQAKDLRDRANEVKGVVSKANMTPLLLPLRNFKSKELPTVLDELHERLGSVEGVRAALDSAERRILASHPFSKPKGSDRRCFSDGEHLFKSPGRHRHGHYRNCEDGSHGVDCLLNARSRLGGSYDYLFHYDCDPARSLNASYPNCHDAPCAPKEKHVNIAPSDAVI